MKKVAIFFSAIAAVVSATFTACVAVGNKATEAVAPPFSLQVAKATRKQIDSDIFVVMPYQSAKLGHRMGGTGFLIETPERGVVLVTNRHVCEALGADAIDYLLEQATLPPPAIVLYAAKRIKKSEQTDLCIIAVPAEIAANRRALRLADEDVEPGDHVNVYGHPFLNPLTKSSGTYLNTSLEPINFQDGTMSPSSVFQMSRVDFMVHPGNSGSPVLDERGDVVGVIFAMEGSNHMGLFIPLTPLRKFLADLE